MERNNGVPAIIYLAFVRNRTLRPYFRSASTEAIFHSLTTFTFTQTPHGLSVPFPARERCPSSWTPCRETAKMGENKGEKETTVTDHGFFGPSEIPKYASQGLEGVAEGGKQESFQSWYKWGAGTSPRTGYTVTGPQPQCRLFSQGCSTEPALQPTPAGRSVSRRAILQSCACSVDFRNAQDSKPRIVYKHQSWGPGAST